MAMNDISDFNSNGWASIHEAAYNGSSEEISAILDHARELHRNVIDLKTIDDMRTTPLLIAALGGHMEIIKLLLSQGADINAQLTYKNSVQHGLVEVAAIRQDFELLQFLHDKFPDLCARLRNLMVSQKIDNESRVPVGRTIEILSQEYPSILAKSKTKEPLSVQQKITYSLINHVEFGACLSEFFHLSSEDAEEATVSTVMVLLNVISDEQFRQKFLQSKGIIYLMRFMKKQKEKMLKKIDAYKKKFKLSPNKSGTKTSKKKRFFSTSPNETEIRTENDYSNEEKLSESDEDDNEFIEQETYIQCACVGQALGAFSKYPDYMEYINRENFSENIIDYVNTLFDWNMLCKEFNIFEKVKSKRTSLVENELDSNHESQQVAVNDDPILFEQYISSYLTCLGILTFESYYNKQCFMKANLFEKLVYFWKQVIYLSENNKNLNNNNKSSNNTPQSEPSQEQETTESNETTETNEVVETIEENSLEAQADLKVTSLNRILDKLSVSLIKQLKLSTIECLGKVLFHFDQLKLKYIFSEEQHRSESASNWPRATNDFIKQLITYLDSNVCLDRDLQLEVLKFLRLICQNDPRMQLKLVDQNEAYNSALIHSIRSLLRKSTLDTIRSNAIHLLWSITGAENYPDFNDRKCLIYRAIGAQKFIDTLFDGDDDINLICLEALSSILNSPPHRDKDTNQLVKIQEEVAKLHAIPAILRLFKSTNEKVLIHSLKAIEAACVGVGYSINVKNQSIVAKQAGIASILDIAKAKTSSIKLKTQAYHTLSMVCLNNPVNKQLMLEHIDYRVDVLIYEMRSIWLNLKPKLTTSLADEIEDLNVQLRAGLALVGFCFKTDEFMRKILTTFGRVDWSHFKEILNKLNSLVERALKSDEKMNYFLVQQLRCVFGFQIAGLHNLISYSYEDPRALGLKLMIDIIPKTNNTYLRAIACDYIGRVILIHDCLLDCFIAINAVEIIAKSTYDSLEQRGDAEKGSASITLGFFTNLHPEARRRLLKLSRKHFVIMDALKYSNELINIDLRRDWKHFLELADAITTSNNANNNNNNSSNSNNSTNNKEIKYNKFVKLPPIKSTKKNNALITN